MKNNPKTQTAPDGHGGRLVTPNRVNHGSRAYGVGHTGGMAYGTLHMMREELRGLVAKRHPSIEEPALESAIRELRSRIERRAA